MATAPVPSASRAQAATQRLLADCGGDVGIRERVEVWFSRVKMDDRVERLVGASLATGDASFSASHAVPLRSAARAACAVLEPAQWRMADDSLTPSADHPGEKALEEQVLMQKYSWSVALRVRGGKASGGLVLFTGKDAPLEEQEGSASAADDASASAVNPKVLGKGWQPLTRLGDSPLPSDFVFEVVHGPLATSLAACVGATPDAPALDDGDTDNEDGGGAAGGAAGPQEERAEEKKVGALVPFFVYGTLRVDDVSKAPWRERFLEGMRAPRKALVRGAQLLVDHYPVVLLRSAAVHVPREGHAETQDRVVGYLCETDDPELYLQKLKIGDEIEGTPEFYARTLVHAFPDGGDGGDGDTPPAPVLAWIYHRPDVAPGSQHLPSGDWPTERPDVSFA